MKKEMNIVVKYVWKMAEQMNKTHEKIFILLRDIPNNEQLALNIAAHQYWMEVQLSQDYELIKNSILTELSATNLNNIEYQMVKIEAILLTVQKQFEERKIKALKN